MNNKIVINHLNRISKLFLFHLLSNKNFELVGILTPFDAKEIVSFLLNDSSHGKFWGQCVNIQKTDDNSKIKFSFSDKSSCEIKIFKTKKPETALIQKLEADILVNFDPEIKKKTLQEWTKIVKRFVISGFEKPKSEKTDIEAVSYGVNHTKITKQKDKLIWINPIETTIIANLIKKLSRKIQIDTCYFQILIGPENDVNFRDVLKKNRTSGYLARSVIDNIIPTKADQNIETLKQLFQQQRFTIIVKGERLIVPVKTGACLSVVLGMERIHEETEVHNLIKEMSNSLIAYEKNELSSQDVVSTSHFAVIDDSLIKLLNSRSNKMLKLSLWYDTESSQAISFFKTLEFVAN